MLHEGVRCSTGSDLASHIFAKPKEELEIGFRNSLDWTLNFGLNFVKYGNFVFEEEQNARNHMFMILIRE